MLKVREYECLNGHRNEQFVQDAGPQMIDCPVCSKPAVRVMSAPRAQLEGITGDFPGATMAWERKRAEKQKVQERKLRDHGDEGWT